MFSFSEDEEILSRECTFHSVIRTVFSLVTLKISWKIRISAWKVTKRKKKNYYFFWNSFWLNFLAWEEKTLVTFHPGVDLWLGFPMATCRVCDLRVLVAIVCGLLTAVTLGLTIWMAVKILTGNIILPCLTQSERRSGASVPAPATVLKSAVSSIKYSRQGPIHGWDMVVCTWLRVCEWARWYVIWLNWPL